VAVILYITKDKKISEARRKEAR